MPGPPSDLGGGVGSRRVPPPEVQSVRLPTVGSACRPGGKNEARKKWPAPVAQQRGAGLTESGPEVGPGSTERVNVPPGPFPTMTVLPRCGVSAAQLGRKHFAVEAPPPITRRKPLLGNPATAPTRLTGRRCRSNRHL